MSKRGARRQRARMAPQVQPSPAPVRIAMKIGHEAVAGARIGRKARDTLECRTRDVFAPYKPAKGVVPAGQGMAMDGLPGFGGGDWIGPIGSGMVEEGQVFLGYPILAAMSQRAEYRVISETIAEDMVREWIELTTAGEDDKSDKVKQIEDELARLDARTFFKVSAEKDGFFGRHHLFIDYGDDFDSKELQIDIGDGQSANSRAKLSKKPIKALKSVEATWIYPSSFNSSNPLDDGWYKPFAWYVMGREVHASRLLTFVGREVPDILKPAYAFGGLSMSQMAKPYVDNWLSTRQGVNDIILAYSVFVLSTDMSSIMSGGAGEDFYNRIDIFNATRNNRGVMAISKDSEDFKNVAAPLSGLDKLQAQAQEHIAAVAKLPLVKLTGISPSGLNASSDGELRCYYDNIAANQEKLFRPHLAKLINLIQISLFGEVDTSIGFKFRSLYQLTEKEEAELDKVEAETDSLRIADGVISPHEARARVAKDPGTPYHGLDIDDAPDAREDDGDLDLDGAAAQDGLKRLFDAAARAKGDQDRSGGNAVRSGG